MKDITVEEIHKIQCLYYKQPIMGFEQGGGEYWMLPVFPHSSGVLFVKALSSITNDDIKKIGDILTHSADRFIVDIGVRKIYIDDRLNDDNPHKNTLIICYESLDVFYKDEYGKVGQYDSERLLMLFDYLRSESYALPAFGYSVPDLVTAGVFKLV